MKTQIHVNRHHIAFNRKHKRTIFPVFSVKNYKANIKGNKVKIHDKDGSVIATFIYRPRNPLPCGAAAWVETNNKVTVI
jgi:hypothetical protein